MAQENIRGAEVIAPDGRLGSAERGIGSDDDTVPLPLESGTTAALDLSEEEILVRRQSHEIGTVELWKEVVAEPHVADVHVWHEELVLEHEPLIPPQLTSEPVGADQTVRIVLREVVATVEKQPVVAEAVRVGRRVVDETQRIETEIRREVADVHKEGDVRVQQHPHE
jgi:uncharacterized protein (TIGR02271 family)